MTSLIPKTPGITPSYWCTWGIQNYCKENAFTVHDGNWEVPVRLLREDMLLSPGAWATRILEKVRADLYLMFDVGWDLPLSVEVKNFQQFGILAPDPARFPSCTGSPVARLEQLNRRCQELGWRGTGLWVSPQLPGEGAEDCQYSAEEVERHWRERLQWSRQAGIGYWKIDCGAHAGSVEYRNMLTRLAAEEAPKLWVEQGANYGPLNDDAELPWGTRGGGSGRYAGTDGNYEQALAILRFSDVLRTYDVTPQLSVATTLDRVATLLRDGMVEPGARGLLNCEDEPYLGAALGCAIGIMRHIDMLPRPGMNYDPAHVRLRMDEVVRAIRWQRLAPAFGVGNTVTTWSELVLWDSWTFSAGDSWATWVEGETIRQGAPAIVARNIALPQVQTTGQAPFVLATRFPNGAIAVATLPRTLDTTTIITPPVEVTVNIGDASAPIGIFGHYQALHLQLSHPLGTRRVYAQDLAGEECVDITKKVTCSGSTITLSSEVINAIGLMAATPGDLSAPSMVLVIQNGELGH